MSKRFINGFDFANMVYSAADMLETHVETINGLNVFPVPDGDTGTNMKMTLGFGVEMLKKKSSGHLGQNAEALSKGLLMGARGNSGVILSQLFRGFSKTSEGLEQLNAEQFASALEQGVQTAYAAVVKPVEGTILTVAREVASHAGSVVRKTSDITELMEEVVQKAKEALAKTPDQLPVLKQVGVVDSGGQGLVFVYEGFLSYLKSGTGSDKLAGHRREDDTSYPNPVYGSQVLEDSKDLQVKAQSKLATEHIEFLYDMEFFINISDCENSAIPFDEEDFRKQLARDGDSILVIVDEAYVKVHVHSRKPGDVLNLAQQYGELSRFHILNMREQHRSILTSEPSSEHLSTEKSGEGSSDTFTFETTRNNEEKKQFGIVAVAVGQGIIEILNSIGVDYVLSGGQTMNPSTEDIVQAIGKVRAHNVFVLPNNSNIILAAEQAKELVEGTEIAVIPCKTIPQGISAALAFQEKLSFEDNVTAMTQAVSQVKSGQVTQSIRETSIDEVNIKEGDFLALLDGKITTAESDLVQAVKILIGKMLDNGEEILTILTGEEAKEEETAEIIAYIESAYPDVELDVLAGGQPLYPYIFSAE